MMMVGKHPGSLSEKTPVAESIFWFIFWEGVEPPPSFSDSPVPPRCSNTTYLRTKPFAEYRYFDVELVLPPEQLMGHQGGGEGDR